MTSDMFKNGLSALLEKRIDFYQSFRQKEHLLDCIEYLFCYKDTGVAKDIFIDSFTAARDEVVFKKIPYLYINEENKELEDMHTDFINDINEIVIEFGPAPHFWNVTKDFFINSIKA